MVSINLRARVSPDLKAICVRTVSMSVRVSLVRMAVLAPTASWPTRVPVLLASWVWSVRRTLMSVRVRRARMAERALMM